MKQIYEQLRHYGPYDHTACKIQKLLSWQLHEQMDWKLAYQVRARIDWPLRWQLCHQLDEQLKKEDTKWIR